jgi:DNA-binding CsgD family transcriptional regulator
MESGSYQFRHALLREAIYGDLLPSERTRHHAAYAGQLAADPEGRAAELAHHCLGSHDLSGALAASVQAADDAERALAPAEALRHLDRALGLWDQIARPVEAADSDRVGLILRAAAAAMATGHVERAIDLSHDALTRLDAGLSPLRVAEVHERLAQSLLAMGRFDDLLRSCHRAVDLVPEDPPSRLRARVTAALAQALWNVGGRQEARHWATIALDAARAVGSTGDEADALITLGLIADYDDPVQALELLAQATMVATRGGEPAIALRAIYNRAVLEGDAGDLAAGIAGLDEATALAQSVGLGWSQFGLGIRGVRCYLRYCAGDWDAGLRLAAEVDEQTAAADPELSVAALAVEIGRGLPTVESRLAQLAEVPSTRRDLFTVIAQREAELALWAGDLDRVRSAVDRGLRAVAPDASLADEELILAALGLTGEANRAERGPTVDDRSVDPEGPAPDGQLVGLLLLDRARRAAERGWRAPHVRRVPTRGWLARAEAEWTRLEGRSDPEAWQTAVDAFSPAYIYEMARCQWRLAEALLGIGDRAHASTAARDAYQVALQLDAGPLRNALEVLARRGRLDLGLGAPHARGDGGLTPRELEVLGLLVEGRSNRQIAERLYISGKTVDVHVTRILAKLGVHSRRDAAARARQFGLDRAMDSGQY